MEGENRDHLDFKNKESTSLHSIIGEEELLFSDKIIKVNRYGLSQERNILITNRAIYNLKKKSNLLYINKIYFIIFNFSFEKAYTFKYNSWYYNKQVNR